jgi:hypothetical protein
MNATELCGITYDALYKRVWPQHLIRHNIVKPQMTILRPLDIYVVGHKT